MWRGWRSAVAGLVLAAAGPVLAASVARAPAAHADGCLPAGGMDLPFTTDGAPPDADLVLTGGGFGHGVGMSQYGAQGAALLGCDYRTILATYYPGTTLDTATSPPVIRLGMRVVDGTGVVATYRTTPPSAGGHDVPWVLCDQHGQDCTQVAVTPAGEQWQVEVDDSAFVLRGPDGAVRWRGGDVVYDLLRAVHDGTVIRIVETGRRLKWGETEFDYSTAGGGRTFVVQRITPAPDGSVSAVDRYLWGLAEVPSSWEPAALQAQAVAARSYALATMAQRRSVFGPEYDRLGMPDCRCHLRTDTRDQYYAGWDKEEADSGGRWRAAVTATADEVLWWTDEQGQRQVAATFYSSSHGGWSEDVADVWGADLPYLQAVDTSRWEVAGRPEDPLGHNPYQRWARGFTAAELATRFGLARFDRLEIVARGPGGRPTVKDGGGVVVYGVDAEGQPVERRYSGEQLRSRLGLRSALVHVGPYTPPLGVLRERVAGDDRILTAVQLSERGWEHAEVVVLARADDPSDALAGSSLAGALDAPLLLTWSDRLEAVVRDEVLRLGADRVVVLGGEQAIDPAVVDALLAAARDAGRELTVERIHGPDRFATAAEIALALPQAETATALVVRGRFPGHPDREWADSLAVSALAARQAAAGEPLPILLVDGGVPQATRDALAARNIRRVWIIGGPATVPDTVAATLRDELGLEVERVAGEDRWGTSRAVADRDRVDAPRLVLATGENFPDGLAAGPFAARIGGLLLLVPSGYDPDLPAWQGHDAWLRARGWTDPHLITVGGERAVSAGTADHVAALLAGR